MEEKKLKKVAKEGHEEPTIEELKNYCNQLLIQRNQVAEELKKVTGVLNKIPILFEVIKNKEVFPKEFVDACVNEVMVIMLPPREETSEEKEKPQEKK